MIDQAGIMMAQGAEIACERIAGVNDNMTQPHYHNYYELYYLEKGERYQRLQDELYVLKPGELMLFSPYIMHMEKRICLSGELCCIFAGRTWMYRSWPRCWIRPTACTVWGSETAR